MTAQTVRAILCASARVAARRRQRSSREANTPHRLLPSHPSHPILCRSPASSTQRSMTPQGTAWLHEKKSDRSLTAAAGLEKAHTTTTEAVNPYGTCRAAENADSSDCYRHAFCADRRHGRAAVTDASVTTRSRSTPAANGACCTAMEKRVVSHALRKRSEPLQGRRSGLENGLDVLNCLKYNNKASGMSSDDPRRAEDGHNTQEGPRPAPGYSACSRASHSREIIFLRWAVRREAGAGACLRVRALSDPKSIEYTFLATLSLEQSVFKEIAACA
jgi:hypothetical protein